MRLVTWSERRAGPVRLLAAVLLVTALLAGVPSVPARAVRARAFGVAMGQANLQVWIHDKPDPAGVGRYLTYFVRVRNLGPDTATNVWLLVPNPHDVQLTLVAGGGGWTTLYGDPYRTRFFATSMAPG